MTTKQRGNFGSVAGAVLAAAGSAVGLGNIWRFPYQVGHDGGAAFILVYIGCVLLLGIPVMVAEFAIGRHSRANTARAYQTLAPGSQWKWIGRWGVLTAFLILSYYVVVAGWTLEYLVLAVGDAFAGKDSAGFAEQFNWFTASPWQPIIWMAVFMIATHFVVSSGVEKGIERSSKIFMPVLFLLLILLAICSVMLPGAGSGLAFLFKPDFGKVNSSTLMSAMGQAFFSLSLGMGCLCTYASYFKRDLALGKTALKVAGIDSLVAVISGLIIFPAAFSVNIQPDAGPSLVFITLPNVFTRAFAGMPWLAYVLSIVFYVLLALAALTSTISLHEVVTAYLNEEFKLTRRRAAGMVSVLCGLMGAACALSMSDVGSGLTLFGMNLFDTFDYLTAKIMMPVGGFFIAIFTGWFLDKKILHSELNSSGHTPGIIYGALAFSLKYIAPIGIALIFINELGWL